MKTICPVPRLSVLLIGLFTLLFSNNLLAQDKPSPKDSVSFFTLSDTTKLTRSDYMASMEKAYQTINNVQDEAEIGHPLFLMKQDADKNREIITVLRKMLTGNSKTNLRNLQLYKRMLTEFRENNESNKALLAKEITRLENAQHSLYAIARDTVLTQFLRERLRDTSSRRSRVRSIQVKWAQADSQVTASLDTLNNWSSAFAMKSIGIGEMLNTIDDKIRQNGIQELKGDYNFLWQPGGSKNNNTAEAVKANSVNIKKVLNYYMSMNSGTTFWLPLFILLFFFWWVRKSFKKLAASPDAATINSYFSYLNKHRFLSLLIFSLSMMPFFDIYAPWSYFELLQLIIVIAVLVVLPPAQKKAIRVPWIIFIVLLLCVGVIDTFHFNTTQRCILIAINVVAIAAGVMLMREIKHFRYLPRFIRIVSIVHIALNVLAIICNLYGRVSIAQGLSNTAIIAITQAVALSVFKQVIQELVLLQLVKSRIKYHLTAASDYTNVLNSLQKPILFVVIFLWTIMFAANMSMYAVLVKIVNAIFTAPIHIGSANFSLGSIILFLLIVWVAHLLQRYVSYFFGDTGNNDEINKNSRSKLVITRLIVLCSGYLLAVAASGLPIDKITIVLGALGVGIGMGLQNIVNNFVSGIILAFDRPLQIGDSVEISGHSGRVKEIGIRSSTLLTADGAEIIIPNGDILSQSITNWTLTNEQRRIELSFTVQTTENKDKVIDCITDAALATDFVLKSPKPVVLMDNVHENEMTLTIAFWCTNISKADWVKSEVRYQVYGKLREHNIIVK
ncbi:MAG: mechanosensitive ion channel [Chitinophagaceae bacterium]